MPFIRYNTGDLGRLEAAPCSCGRQSPRLLSMEGRLDDVITGLQGEIIFPFVIRKALLKEEWIRRYQLIYHRDASISFLLEQPDPLSEDQVQRVNALLQSIFGPRGNIREIKATPLLPRTRGQKEKLIIKE
jgi:phenylacetate-coenzyme A ligase PaaK-like adenylate-forming protein